MRIIDLHADTLYACDPSQKGDILTPGTCHISSVGLQKGGYMAQCFAIYQPGSVRGEDGYVHFHRQCHLYKRLVEGSPILASANNAASVWQNDHMGQISALLTVENADFLQEDISRLKAAEEAGVCLLGLLHNEENCLGYPAVADENAPLKPFGKAVIDQLNSTAMLVDVSHLNRGGFWDVARIARKPIVATHAGCRALYDHPRNLDDQQIRQIAASGGVVGLVFYSHFLNGTTVTGLEDLYRHMDHLLQVGGEDTAALGTDFDGMECELFIEGANGMQTLAQALIQRYGYSVTEKICYRNALRILR